MTRRLTREVNRVAAAHGFQPGEHTGGGHLRYRHKSGVVVHTSSTPSDRRAWLNLVAQFRRAARGVAT